jgi:hypothetical protein
LKPEKVQPNGNNGNHNPKQEDELVLNDNAPQDADGTIKEDQTDKEDRLKEENGNGNGNDSNSQHGNNNSKPDRGKPQKSGDN